MAKSQILLKQEFRPDHAQLEFGAVGGRYPDWGFGTEPVVANDEKVVVSTLPDIEGNATLEVWQRDDQTPPEDAGELIYDGVIRLSRRRGGGGHIPRQQS